MLDLEPKKLLPPNATDFEIDVISVVVNRINRVYADIRVLTDSKLKRTHKNLLPWVIEEFGFGSVSKYIPDNDEFMAQGIAWKKDRGTPASVDRALGWIFREDELRENTKEWHWTNVEIRLTQDIPSLDIVKDIVYLVRKSLPARAVLSRVWSGIDYPMFILNESELNNSRLNVPGGEWDDDLKLWLYINNKVDTVFLATGGSLQSFSSILTVDYLKQTKALNNLEFLNSVPGPISTLTSPTFSNNHTTLGAQPINFSSFITLNDYTNFTDITEHVGAY